MLKLTNVSKLFVEHQVLKDVTLHVDANSRIGLIGRNGAGKSTLLRIIMGEVDHTKGSIYRAPHLQVGVLTQEPQITFGNTLTEEVKSVFADANALAAEEADLLKQLETVEGDEMCTVLDRLAEVQDLMVRMDIDTLDGRISRMLTGLGFSLEEFDREVSQFSGGWQMRINLAKVLLQGADILLLDEPTNHLDLEACEWLEGFLKTYPGGLIIVSHDRRFLDETITKVAELEFGNMTLWDGNYTKYLVLKEEAIALELAAVNRQEKELEKQTAFVERFRASATKSTQAKSREKQLNKVERLEVTRTDTRRITVNFPVPEPSGKQVMVLDKISKSFGSLELFKNATAEIVRGHRIFLLGANGCGKTTLFRIILGLEKPDSGTITEGHNLRVGYFSQNQLETLDANKNLFETLQETKPDMPHTEIRGLLGRLLFTGDQVFKPVSVLSGGEKSKLALARLVLNGSNMLLLDEPTNHMDIPAKEVMQGAFKEYEGSILCISHDRHFIESLATDIWEIHEGQLLQYPGGYDYYLDKRDEMRAKKSLAKAK